MIELASPLRFNRLLVMLFAWLNLSHREKATVFVIVRTSAMTRIQMSDQPLGMRAPARQIKKSDIPTRINQMKCSRTMEMMAMAIQAVGMT